MKNTISKIIGMALATGLAIGAGASTAYAASEFPINKPKEQEWSFSGPFGTWDLGQLQRGFKVYQGSMRCMSRD